MFKVECPQCRAPYQVDERRVPPAGVNMRCPKCGASFVVHRPEDALPDLPETRGTLVHDRAKDDSSTMLGVAAPVKPTMSMADRTPLGPPVGSAANPVPPPRRKPEPMRTRQEPADLPSVSRDALEAPDLPAPAERSHLPSPRDSAELPETTAALPAKPRGKSAAASVHSRSSVPDSDDGLDLPSIPAPKPSLPARKASLPAEMPAPPRVVPPEESFDFSFADLNSIPPKADSPKADSPKLAAKSEQSDRAHAATAPTGQRFAVPRPSPRGASGELPSPLEPEFEGSFDSIIPLSEEELGSIRPVAPDVLGQEASAASDSSGGFSMGDALELPSPAADFDQELARGLEPEDPGDFGADFLPSDAPPTAPSAAPVAGSKAPRASSDPFGPSGSLGVLALPDLPDLDGSPSLPRGGKTTVVESLQDLDALDDDPFTLESLPPSRAVSSDAVSSAMSSAMSSAGSFLDEDDVMSMPSGLSTSDEDSAPPPPPRPQAAASKKESGRGSAQGYGEVAFGDDDESAGFDVDGEGAEFGAIPQEEKPNQSAGAIDADVPSRSLTSATPAIHSRAPAPAPAATRKPSKVGLWVLLGVLGSAVGGGALALLPQVGPFGVHWISDVMNRTAHADLAARTADRVVALRERDVFGALPEILELCQSARAQAPRYAPLAAYTAFTQYVLVARFGGQPKLQASAKVLLDELIAKGAEPDLEYLSAAQAAQALVAGDLKAAERGPRASNSLERLVFAAEVALAADQSERATELWTQAVQKKDSPWTNFGLARVFFRAGDHAQARSRAERVLEQNAEHPGARLMLAEIAYGAGDEPGALASIDLVLEKPAVASPRERVLAHTLLGEIHLDRGRISKAEGEFTLALEGDSKALRATLGMARTHVAAGRHAAALARFELAAEDPAAPLDAKIGIAKSHLALERVEKAREVLVPLAKEHPKHPEVSFWVAKLAEANGDKKAAEAAYRVAIDEGGTRPIAVDAYVAMAQSHSQLGQFDTAEQLLAEAQKKFPRSVQLKNNLGQVALSQGRYDVALQEFRAARALDPSDVTAAFNEGSSLRRLGRFEDAWQIFEDVGKMDKNLPGLPLERGLLLEQSGRGAEALKEYELALAKDPDDPDLKLRVGCARVTTGDGKAAEPILLEVVKARSRVSEVHNCLGRALFLQGRNIEALKRLQGATELDPNRAEYQLYVGWVANEVGQVALAKQALNTALSLDQGLADAYWQRGVLSLKLGGAGDAIIDISKALKLRPGRFEAHADLAQALFQMARTREALWHWQQALSGDAENPTWLFRYGKLLNSQHMNAEAATRLEKAIELAQKEASPPGWLWEAHHLAAVSLGATPRALFHWRKFLELGPENSPYRSDAKRALRAAGQVWSGN